MKWNALIIRQQCLGLIRRATKPETVLAGYQKPTRVQLVEEQEQ